MIGKVVRCRSFHVNGLGRHSSENENEEYPVLNWEAGEAAKHFLGWCTEGDG